MPACGARMTVFVSLSRRFAARASAMAGLFSARERDPGVFEVLQRHYSTFLQVHEPFVIAARTLRPELCGFDAALDLLNLGK